MKTNKVFWGIGSILMLGIFLVVAGCASTKGATAGKNGMIPYTTKVCSSAKITKVNSFMKKYKGASRFHVAVGIKNVSSQPKRYRLHIFLPNGVSSGGLYPRKGKPPVVKPGKVLVQTYPMYYSKLPEKFELVVTELPQK